MQLVSHLDVEPVVLLARLAVEVLGDGAQAFQVIDRLAPDGIRLISTQNDSSPSPWLVDIPHETQTTCRGRGCSRRTTASAPPKLDPELSSRSTAT